MNIIQYKAVITPIMARSVKWSVLVTLSLSRKLVKAIYNCVWKGKGNRWDCSNHSQYTGQGSGSHPSKTYQRPLAEGPEAGAFLINSW